MWGSLSWSWYCDGEPMSYSPSMNVYGFTTIKMSLTCV
jgi:hypothetical protein